MMTITKRMMRGRMRRRKMMRKKVQDLLPTMTMMKKLQREKKLLMTRLEQWPKRKRVKGQSVSDHEYPHNEYPEKKKMQRRRKQERRELSMRASKLQ